MPIVQCTAADGAEWEVFEVARIADAHEAVRPRLAGGWLCFQRGDGHKVRVGRGDYPVDWATLPEAELLALMAHGLSAQPSVLPRRASD